MLDFAAAIAEKQAKTNEIRANMQRLSAQIIDRLPNEIAFQLPFIARQIGEQQDTVTNRLGRDGVTNLIAQVEAEKNAFVAALRQLLAEPELWDHNGQFGGSRSSATIETSLSNVPREMAWRFGSAINRALSPFGSILVGAGYNIGSPYGDREHLEILKKLSFSPEIAKVHEGYANLAHQSFRLATEIAELEKQRSKAQAKNLWGAASNT